ncbi:N-terminal methylation site-containing protein [Ruminococcaceae bacterium YRB3002]|nr:N-terminal methylation site-containing protein [Ruminococcaceae bacterium YRB3002]
MKRTTKTKKGFTLVELIVVLVILAILAAMLIPALTGYIDEARKKKDYQAASEVLTAAQAVVAQYYGDDTTPTATEAKAWVTKERIQKLTGEVSGDFDISNITFADEADATLDLTITGIKVTINKAVYEWNGAEGKWEEAVNA